MQNLDFIIRHMGGSLTVVIRRSSGETISMGRWTNSLAAYVQTEDFIKEDDNLIKEYLSHKKDGAYIYDYPLAPDGYGIVVFDFKNKVFLQHQGYSNLEFIMPVSISLEAKAVYCDADGKNLEFKTEQGDWEEIDFGEDKESCLSKLTKSELNRFRKLEPTMKANIMFDPDGAAMDFHNLLLKGRIAGLVPSSYRGKEPDPAKPLVESLASEFNKLKLKYLTEDAIKTNSVDVSEIWQWFFNNDTKLRKSHGRFKIDYSPHTFESFTNIDSETYGRKEIFDRVKELGFELNEEELKLWNEWIYPSDED